MQEPQDTTKLSGSKNYSHFDSDSDIDSDTDTDTDTAILSVAFLVSILFLQRTKCRKRYKLGRDREFDVGATDRERQPFDIERSTEWKRRMLPPLGRYEKKEQAPGRERGKLECVRRGS